MPGTTLIRKGKYGNLPPKLGGEGEEEVVEKMKSEVAILKALATNKDVVSLSLQRLEDIRENVSVESLFQTDVCSVLMGEIRTKYN